MADSGTRSHGDARLVIIRAAGAWACGSVLMGTVALIFVRSAVRVMPVGLGTVRLRIGVPIGTDDLIPSLFQLALAYLAGGLPFGLVTAMLLCLAGQRRGRRRLRRADGGGLSHGGGHSPLYPHNVFALYADAARSFFSAPTATLY
jgi:hypothetical protein